MPMFLFLPFIVWNGWVALVAGSGGRKVDEPEAIKVKAGR